MKLVRFCLLAVALFLIPQVGQGGAIARADTNPDAGTNWDGNVHLDLTPYIWVPTLDAVFRFDPSDVTTNAPLPPLAPILASGGQATFNTSIGPSKYLAKINFALMATGTLRKGNLALFTDLLNTNISGSTSNSFNLTGPLGNNILSANGQASSQAVATIWTVGPSYTVYHAKGTSVDLLLGGRFIWLSANASVLLTGNGPLGLTYGAGFERKASYGDVIGGTYGQFALSRKWSIPFYADLGTGTPAFTWQGVLGVKYGRTILAWRHLAYNGSGNPGLVQTLNMGGPMLGYHLSF